MSKFSSPLSQRYLPVEQAILDMLVNSPDGFRQQSPPQIEVTQSASKIQASPSWSLGGEKESIEMPETVPGE